MHLRCTSNLRDGGWRASGRAGAAVLAYAGAYSEVRRGRRATRPLGRQKRVKSALTEL